MEINFNGRTFNVVEYDKTVHGEITNWPSEFVKDLNKQDLITQIKRFFIKKVTIIFIITHRT